VRRSRRRWCSAALLAALAIALLSLFLAPAPVLARPGGGESYSGGGDSGGGGGGGGGGELAFWLVRLWIEFVIRYPAIGVPATIAIIAFIVMRRRRRAAAGPQAWDSAPSRQPPSRPRGRDLEAIRGRDPQFSTVLFEDFTYALYARAHQARSDPRTLEALSPYLSAGARQHLAGRQPAGVPVAAVVVGALRVLDLQLPPSPGTPLTAQLAGVQSTLDQLLVDQPRRRILRQTKEGK